MAKWFSTGIANTKKWIIRLLGNVRSSPKLLLKIVLSRFDYRLYSFFGNFIRGHSRAIFAGMVVLLIVAAVGTGFVVPQLYSISMQPDGSAGAAQSQSPSTGAGSTDIVDVSPPLESAPPAVSPPATPPPASKTIPSKDFKSAFNIVAISLSIIGFFGVTTTKMRHYLITWFGFGFCVLALVSSAVLESLAMDLWSIISYIAFLIVVFSIAAFATMITMRDSVGVLMKHGIDYRIGAYISYDKNVTDPRLFEPFDIVANKIEFRIIDVRRLFIVHYRKAIRRLSKRGLDSIENELRELNPLFTAIYSNTERVVRAIYKIQARDMVNRCGNRVSYMLNIVMNNFFGSKPKNRDCEVTRVFYAVVFMAAYRSMEKEFEQYLKKTSFLWKRYTPDKVVKDWLIRGIPLDAPPFNKIPQRFWRLNFKNNPLSYFHYLVADELIYIYKKSLPYYNKEAPALRLIVEGKQTAHRAHYQREASKNTKREKPGRTMPRAFSKRTAGEHAQMLKEELKNSEQVLRRIWAINKDQYPEDESMNLYYLDWVEELSETWKAV